MRIGVAFILALAVMHPAWGADHHAVNVVGANQYTGSRAQTIIDNAVNTGAMWVMLGFVWHWSEPFDVTPSPGGWNQFPGVRVSGYHDYRFDAMDYLIPALQQRGINVVLGVSGHPTFVGGNTCTTTGGGSSSTWPCGVIRHANKQRFKDYYYDLLYTMAGRYPGVKHWVIWNEPNLDVYFSPEPPLLYQSPAAEYIDLAMIPAHSAIRARIPDATIIGPEIYTCKNTGSGCSNYDHNWGYTTNWLNDWANTLLVNWPQYFDKFSIHNYSDDDWGMRNAVGELWQRMEALNQRKYIWTTEFNFKNGTCDLTEQTVANLTCKTYKYMTWERAFYFSLNAGCFGLTRDDLTPKSFLFPAFQSIVAGIYYCQ